MIHVIYILIILTLLVLLSLKLEKSHKLELETIRKLNQDLDKIDRDIIASSHHRDMIDSKIKERTERYNQLNEMVANFEGIQEEKIEELRQEANEKIQAIKDKVQSKQNEYDSLISPMELIEKEQMEKLFYCIYLTDEDKYDIMYLLTEVAPKVKHKDIVSKLVWQEFVKKPLDVTLQRIGATDNPGIYKITNIKNNKCYVGKAVNVKKRIQDHFKSVVGIQSVSDQSVHHEIMKEGLDSWMLEQVCECSKEELSEKEKFYIDFFKATEYGYNLKAGG